VSSADQRDGFSLAAQKTLGDEYAKMNRLKVIRHWSVDESASKENDRKHFFEMMEFVRSKQIKDIIFDKVDRACRGFKSADIIEEMVESGVRFHFPRDNLVVDSSSPPQEKFRFYLSTIMGKYYIDNLKSEIHKGLAARANAGLLNGKAPIGYSNTRDAKNNRSVVTLDPEVAPAVSDVFKLYATGNYGLIDLAGTLSHRIGRDVTKRIIEGLLANPFYYGGLKCKDGSLKKGAHEALIDKATWDACQKIRGIRAAGASRNPQNSTVVKPLMGMIRCAKCDHSVTGEAKLTKGKTYVYYHCSNMTVSTTPPGIFLLGTTC
jgi:site-specific DNA recombinase